MPSEGPTAPETSARFLTSLAEVAPATWDALGQNDYPFLHHRFLYGLETTGCTDAESGWQPCHLLLERNGQVIGALPQYLKSHSYGEYVFDWSWADAWRRSGLNYYPKLLCAIPFTPATGPRLMTASGFEPGEIWPLALAAIQEFAERQGLSSWHLLFPDSATSDALLQSGLSRRVATQFHWFNEGFADFDEFLGTCASRKRKSLRRERRRVAEQGLELVTRQGDDITESDWQAFHHFYQMTYAKRSGHGGYLTKAFFLETAPSLGDQVIMVTARDSGTPVAAALYFRDSDTLYGRYWGALREYDCLHFEACYYQGIDYCIREGLQRFDPGAQGEHKIQRGFRPVPTYSNHWIADPRLASAVQDFTEQEAGHTEAYMREAETLLPFKQDG
ncbi:MAG: GNAT family N-acetyltransferase [Pseudomonadota bacterium]